LEPAELIDYYRRRAGEYEAIYAKPERQADLAALRREVAALVRGRRMLEIACGTGYWTEVMAVSAASVVATDVAEEPLALARAKALPTDKVRFGLADAYALDASLGRFDGAFAGFWWSHVPRGRLHEFFASLHARLEPGAAVILLDNRYVEGSSTPIMGFDAEGNSYQLRRMGDGSQVRVLKNFPSEDSLRADLAPAPVCFQALDYYWLAHYRPQ
jgi:2-polyprenyl-3-methyl-5-hydroxy-6-metoxy-1,4-benzoquinol methylase